MPKPVLTGFAGRKALVDVETYPNFCLIKFQDVDTEQIARFVIDETRSEGQAAYTYFQTLSVIITYNGHHFDDAVLDLAFKGVEADTIYQFADMLINGGTRRGSPFLDRYGDPKPGCPLSIDLAQLLRRKTGEKEGEPTFVFPSLKALGNRFGYPHLQTLPVKPGTVLTADQKSLIDSYNTHDNAIARRVLEHLNAGLEMRRVLGEQFGLNLTSRADAKLAEMIVSTAYTRAVNEKIMSEWQDDDEPEYFKLEQPKKHEWVCGGSDILSKGHSFTDPELVALVQKIKGWTLHWRRTTDSTGAVKMEKPSFGAKVKLGDKVYSCGLGGLHSEDDPLVIEADEEYALTDVDVSSYYPGLVVNEGIAPSHLDPFIFCAVFNNLMETRLDAKARAKKGEPGQKEIAQGMKVAINSGGYGKLSDPYSPFRDPPKGAAITINGQLILLKLIEEMNSIDGVRVLSANTDGVLVHHPRAAMEQIYAVIKRVRETYNLNTFDVTEVLRLCRASVNEYVLSYRDPDTGEVGIKGRGAAFNDGSDTDNLAKKTDKAIIKRALIQFLLFNMAIEQTIRTSADLISFCDYATLDEAWDHIEDSQGNHLPQRTNRWYESVNGTTLHKVRSDGSKQKMPRTQSVVVVNDLPTEFPSDINYGYYIASAQELADKVLHSQPKGEGRRKKAENLSDDEREEWEDRINTEDADVDWLVTLNLNFYRDLYIGRVAINAYDSMRAALKALWKSTLGLSKADLLWCFDSFNTADGYFNRQDKRKSMLSYIDWVVNNIVPMEKPVLPEDEDAKVSVTVKVMADEPGAGKTREALKLIVNGGPRIYWWSINKIDPIARERAEELKVLAEQTGAAIDFMAIHTGGEGRGTMKMRIDARMASINAHPARDDITFVTLITHKTLVDHVLDGVTGTLLIDEPVQAWEQQHFNFGSSYRTVRSLLAPALIGEDYDGDFNPHIDSDTQAIRLVLTDEGRREYADTELRKDSIRGGRHRWLVEQAGKTSGRVFTFAHQWNQMDQEGGGNMDAMALLHPTHIAHFDECYMMAAYFKELIIYRLWTDLYDVDWQFLEQDGGWKRQVPLADRVTLYYVLENRQISDKYLRDDPRHSQGMAMAVKEFFSDAPYIWSVGEAPRKMGGYSCLRTHVEDKDGIAQEAYLTPKANGINCYQNVHGAAWLGSVKLPGDLLSMLKRIWGSKDAEWIALREFELYSVLQFLARTNSRRFDSTDQVRHVVADYVQAAYIAEMWKLPPDRILPLPMRDEVKARLDDVASGKGGRPKGAKQMSPDERRLYERERKAARRAKTAAAASV